MTPDDRNNAIEVGKVDTATGQVNIRGYNVPYDISSVNDASESLEASLSICGVEIAQSCGFLQFRWLQTVTQTGDPNRDRVLLDDIAISSYFIQKYEILVDDFDNQTMLK